MRRTMCAIALAWLVATGALAQEQDSEPPPAAAPVRHVAAQRSHFGSRDESAHEHAGRRAAGARQSAQVMDSDGFAALTQFRPARRNRARNDETLRLRPHPDHGIRACARRAPSPAVRNREMVLTPLTPSSNPRIHPVHNGSSSTISAWEHSGSRDPDHVTQLKQSSALLNRHSQL